MLQTLHISHEENILALQKIKNKFAREGSNNMQFVLIKKKSCHAVYDYKLTIFTFHFFWQLFFFLSRSETRLQLQKTHYKKQHSQSGSENVRLLFYWTKQIWNKNSIYK